MQRQQQPRMIPSADQQLAPHDVVVPREQLLYKTVRGLAIAQLVIGIICILLGILAVLLSVWYGSQYRGIWGGLWIVVAGVIGMASSKNPNSCCVIGIYMGFSIVSTVVSFFSGVVFVHGIMHYSSCSDIWGDQPCDDVIIAAGLGLKIPFLTLMITEFFVSIAAAAYACKSANCCTSCSQEQTTTIITNQQYQPASSNHDSSYGNGEFPGSYPGFNMPYPNTGFNGQPPQYPGYPNQFLQPNTGALFVGHPTSQSYNVGNNNNNAQPAVPSAPIQSMAPPPYDSLR